MAYRDISRGVSLAKDHANYLAWLDKDTSARQTAYAALGGAKKITTAHEAGYIIPFGSSSVTLVYLPARIISVAQTATVSTAVSKILQPYITTGTEFTALSTAVKDDLLSGAKKFKFAKLSVKQLVAAAAEKLPSRITGRLYYRNHTNTCTASFGKTIAADTYDATVAAIKANADFVSLTTGTNAKNHYRFIPEKG